MHSAVWLAAAVWAVVGSEVVADSTPALQWALEDLHLHTRLLPGAHLRHDHLPPGLLLPAHSRQEHSHPDHLRHGHLLLQEHMCSRIPLGDSHRSGAGQTVLYASATDFYLTIGLTTTGSSSIADFSRVGALAASPPSSLIVGFYLVLRSSADLLLAHPSGILFMTDTPDILATRQTITRSLQHQWLITVITAATLNSQPMSSN